MVIPSKKFGFYASYSMVQILVISLHLIYLSWVLYYFSNGYRNENLESILLHVNNAILFSLIPVLLLNKKITSDTLIVLKTV